MNNKNVIVVESINKNNYKEYEGKIVEVENEVNFMGLCFDTLPITFTKVGGNFNCMFTKLKSLEGAPEVVGGSFDCSFNQLKSLEGAPKEVGGIFDCSQNYLISLDGAPEKVGRAFFV